MAKIDLATCTQEQINEIKAKANKPSGYLIIEGKSKTLNLNNGPIKISSFSSDLIDGQACIELDGSLTGDWAAHAEKAEKSPPGIENYLGIFKLAANYQKLAAKCQRNGEWVEAFQKKANKRSARIVKLNKIMEEQNRVIKEQHKLIETLLNKIDPPDPHKMTATEGVARAIRKSR